MKHFKLNQLVILGLLLSLFQSVGSANPGGGVGDGGGDLCEDRIKIIRDDFKNWIANGGHQELNLPTGVSTHQYSTLMMRQMNLAKIRCVGRGDLGYPVLVEGTPKVCRFEINSGHPSITCDYDKLQSINESDQYVLIHHEYAGLAEIESPDGDDSNYVISNQISGFLKDEIVKKIVVKPSQKPADPFNSESCNGTFNVPISKYFNPGMIESKVAGKYQIISRERNCNSSTGCQEWKSISNPRYYYAFDDSLPSEGDVFFDVDKSSNFRLFLSDPDHFDISNVSTPISALGKSGILVVPINNPSSYVLRPIQYPYNPTGRYGTYDNLSNIIFGQNCFRAVITAKSQGASPQISERETVIRVIFQ